MRVSLVHSEKVNQFGNWEKPWMIVGWICEGREREVAAVNVREVLSEGVYLEGGRIALWRARLSGLISNQLIERIRLKELHGSNRIPDNFIEMSSNEL